MPVWVSFKVDDPTKQMFDDAANDRGVSLSTWLQEVVADAVKAIEARRAEEQPSSPGDGD
jgi:hypothetical protein